VEAEYLDDHSDDSGVAGAIAIDLRQAIVRDVGWIAVEILLHKPGAFTEALAWYRKGTRLFGWVDGFPPNGRPVLLRGKAAEHLDPGRAPPNKALQLTSLSVGLRPPSGARS
jgi:hypothetical protein